MDTRICLNYSIQIVTDGEVNIYKKLSYCWETVRRESMPRIAEGRENDNLGWNDLQMYFKVIKVAPIES